MADFLSEEEKQKLRKKCYMNWLDAADGDSLVKFCFTESFITPREKQILDKAQTTADKNGYLFDDVLMKMTRTEFLKIIEYLERPEGRDKDKKFGKVFREVINSPKTCIDITDSSISYSSPPCSPATADSTDVDQSALFRSKSKKEYIDYYPTKEMSSHGCGRGICFIIANFTNDLAGYNRDIGKIRLFFENTLRCTVKTSLNRLNFENLTKEKFKEALVSMRNYVEADDLYDRFFLFVLSHGEEDGILMCKPDGKTSELDDNGKCKKISTDEIVKTFLHDQMSSMKGLPKLVFFQACRGTDIIEAAGPFKKKKHLELWKMPSDEIAVEADIMVCYSTTPSYLCWVSSFGSWFIGEVLEAFKKYHSTEDVGIMMRVVKDVISKKQSQVKFEEGDEAYDIDGEDKQMGQLKKKGSSTVVAEGCISINRGKKVITVDARQMPTVMDNLTKKFYLAIPD